MRGESVQSDKRRHTGLNALAAAIAVLQGCSAQQSNLDATRAAASLAQDAKLSLIWPCLHSTLVDKGPGSHPMNILIGGASFGTVVYCSHSTVDAPSGTHAIRVADPNFDIAGAFGNKGELFTIPQGGNLYLRIDMMGTGSNARLIEVDKSRADAEISAIESNR